MKKILDEVGGMSKRVVCYLAGILRGRKAGTCVRGEVGLFSS